MSTQQDRVRFAEKNIEEISDLYNAISKIPWTDNFKLPKFEQFVQSFCTMMMPARKGEDMKVLLTKDWLDEEAEEVDGCESGEEFEIFF